MKNLKLLLVFDSLIRLGVAATLIVAACTNQQYSFYIFLRWFVFITFLYFSYRSYNKKETGLIFLFLGIAVIFNPIQNFIFQKGTWHLLDYLVAIIIVLTVVYDWFHNNLVPSKSSLTMNDNTLIKKKIAKEVLLFFSAICLVVLIWGSLILRNAYYNSSAANHKEKITSLTIQLDSLPKDKIKSLYDGFSQNFVVNYNVKDVSYSIPKKEEKKFIETFPDAVKMSNDINGYSYFNLNSVTLQSGETVKYFDIADLGKKVKEKYSEYKDIADYELGQKVLKKYSQHSDSTIQFDYVDIKTFSEFLKVSDYRENFYSIFRGEKYAITGYSDAGLPIFKNPDLGSRESFERDIQYALKNSEVNKETRDEISNKLEIEKNSLTNATNNIWDNERINWFLLSTILIISIILYPLRLIFLLIRWAIKTVR